MSHDADRPQPSEVAPDSDGRTADAPSSGGGGGGGSYSDDFVGLFYEDPAKAAGVAGPEAPSNGRTKAIVAAGAMALAVAGVAFGGLLGGGGDSGEGGLTETAAASGSGEAPAEGSTTVPEQLAATGEAADAQAAEEDEMEDGAATPALGRTDDSAMIVIEGDTIVLEGTMASQEAIDAFVASLDGVTQPIDNRIRVEAGAGTGANRVVIANDVFFEFGSSELGEVDQATLNSVISFCLARPDLILTVVGHTDSIGSAEANQALSLARAEEVMALLIAEGVPAELLRVRGDGETTPRATNDTEEGRAENRRIEFEFSPS